MTSIPQEIPSTIVKADRIGRNRNTAESKTEVLAAFEASSLRGQAFAGQCGIKYPTFKPQLTKRRKQETHSAETTRPFYVLGKDKKSQQEKLMSFMSA